MSTPLARNRTHRLEDAAALAGLLLLCLLFYGVAVPTGNEHIYLLQPWHLAHPDFLAGDWSLTARSGGHQLFSLLTRGAMELLPLQAVGWLGRALSWVLILAALLRIGRKLGLTPLLAALGIALWMSFGQSLVGGEWLLGGFEAKALAWALVLWGTDQLLEGRWRAGGALAGLGLTMHAAVGLSALPALALGLRLAGTPRRGLRDAGAAAFVGALPGLIWAFLLAEGTSTAPGLWEMVARVRMPFHLDPFSFGEQKLLLLALITGLNLAYAWRHPSPVVRCLAGMQVAGALIFLAGVLARLAGSYELLRLFPFRFLPPLALLVFLWQALLLLVPTAPERPRPLLRVAMVVALLALPSALNAFLGRAERLREEESDPGLVAAFTWVRDSTPPFALAIVPPWRRDAFWLTQRALFVSWSAIPYTAIPEWRDRMTALVGPLDAEGSRGLTAETMARRYAALPEDSITSLGRNLGAHLLVSEARYALPVLHQSGEWRVYDLTEAP